MAFELHCPRCTHDFSVPADSPAAEVLEQLADEGPWCTLGDGETLEDKVYTALSCEQAVCCPGCGSPVSVGQESLGEFAQELLAQW
jgi:hypothetical protein